MAKSTPHHQPASSPLRRMPPPTAAGLSVPAADVLRLIQAHLLEVGLPSAARALARESGVGLAGSLQHPHNWAFHCAAGNHAVVLEQLSLIDRARARIGNDLVAAVHELAILEVADAGDLGLAASLLRLADAELRESAAPQQESGGDGAEAAISRARLLDQKLAALANLRARNPAAPVPADWYYAGSRQEMRDAVGSALARAVPHQPPGRLTALLQQAIQWEVYTGELPQIKRWWDDDGDDERGPEGTKKKKKKRTKEFDLVLGRVSVDPVVVGESRDAKEPKPSEAFPREPISIIKLGKQVTCESAVFLPDQSGLVTGSSDGLIEIWDASRQYSELRLDLPYQQAEELLGQDSAVTALAVSNDSAVLASGSAKGQVIIWRIDTGKCLRTLSAHQSRISCLAFSPDASHILTGSGDGLVREFGLRSGRILKEFNCGGTAINHVSYRLNGEQFIVVTASGDGTVRLWDRESLDAFRIMRPVSSGDTMSKPGSSIVMDANHIDPTGAAAIHSVLHLHTPESTMIVVPRGYRAFLVTYFGVIVRTFEDPNAVGDKAFVAATVSPSNRSLYCVREDGVCCVFSVNSGELLGTIRDFGASTTRMPKDSSAEVSVIFTHPTKNVIAAYSNDKRQSRGQVIIWE